MGGKWTILAISVLAEQPRRFNGLKRLIGGISQQILTRTLKALEHDGMVTRTVPRYYLRAPIIGALASQARHDCCPQSPMIRGVLSPGLVGGW
ncbi:winged helix-turn-helix transcriptional regulator, partial [Ralstonia pseudosolanacearum]